MAIPPPPTTPLGEKLPPPSPPPATIPPPLRPYTNPAPFNTALQNLCNEHNTVLHRNYNLECRIASLEANAATLLSGQSLQPSADLATRVAGLRAGLQTTPDHRLAGMGRGEVEKGVEILTVVNDLMARDRRMSEAMLAMLMSREEGTTVNFEEADGTGLIEGLKGDVDFFGVQFHHVRKELRALKTSHAASLSKQDELAGELGRLRKLAEAKEKLSVLRTKEKQGQDASLARHNKLQAEKTATLKEKDQKIQVLEAKVTEKENHVYNLNVKVTRLESEQKTWQTPSSASHAAPAIEQSLYALRTTAPTYVPYDYTPIDRSAPRPQTVHQSVTLELRSLQSEATKSKASLQAQAEKIANQRKALATNYTAMEGQSAKTGAQTMQIAELKAHITS
ncbi:hypothetical protein LTR95_016550 [Oleoguttula sp. CCFEE 5521]